MEDIIRINFVDFWKGFDKTNNFFYNFLSSYWNVQIDKNPDYLICSVFGMEHIKYGNCIKILYVGENLTPDFNLYDYALGFDYLDFGDRFLRLPLYVFYNEAVSWKRALEKHKFEFLDNRKFCNAVISNSIADPKRDEMIRLLNTYKQMDFGGRYRNNVGYLVKDKLEFASHYKFSLCFENSSTLGYTTEKIVDAFAAGTIPIYWGNPKIGAEFNEKSFINCHAFENLESALKKVKEVDLNDELYYRMLSEPIYNEDSHCIKYKESSYLYDFFENIFKQNFSEGKRRNTIYIGDRYQKRMKRLYYLERLFYFPSKIIYYMHNRFHCWVSGREKREKR